MFHQPLLAELTGRVLCVIAVAGWACASVGLEQRERIAAYEADQSRTFVSQLAEAKIDPRQADLVAIVTADAINASLKKLEQHVFPAGQWEFVPTHVPEVELKTGSALLRVTGEVRQKQGGTRAEVTLVGGLTVRGSDDGAHLFLKPSALAVVPTLKVSVLDFALGSFLRSFAQTQAQVYLEQRIGEIDVPVALMFPIHRGALSIDHKLEMPDASGAVLRVELPEASAQVKLNQLYVWPMEGRLVILVYADVVRVIPIMPPAVTGRQP